MRTLKKTLCLVLALVMCLGLMSSAFATSKVDNFADFKDVTHQEAADYLVAAGVVHGVGNGQLNPSGTLTRAEAATLVAYMLLGKDNADAYQVTAIPFTDVSANHWGARYIQFCANEGYISGRGEGIFDPDAKITGLEMGSILLRVLGYGAKEDTTLTWPTGVQAKVLTLGMFNDIRSAAKQEPIDRDTAFQMVFNTMTNIATVQYNASVGVYFTGTNFMYHQAFKVGDADWDTDGFKNTLSYKTAYLEPNLINDDLGRQMREWKHSKTGQIVTNKYRAYADVAAVDARSNANALSKQIEVDSKDKDAGIWVNGGEGDKPNATIAKEASGTDVFTAKQAAEIAIQAAKNGFKVDLIDTNENGLADRIIIVVEYIARVEKVTAGKGPDPAKATVQLFDNASGAKIELSGEYYDDVASLKEGDILVVVPYVTCSPTPGSGPENPTTVDPTPKAKEAFAKDEDQTISAEVATPKYSDVAVTSFEGDKSGNANAEKTLSVTFGGATYNYSAVAAKGADPITDTDPFVTNNGYKLNGSTYDFYFNSSNVILGVTEHKVNESIPNVLYVTAIESRTTNNSLFGNTQSYAARIKGVDVTGKESVYDLKLDTAKGADKPDYLLSDDGLKETEAEFGKDEQYLKIGNISGDKDKNIKIKLGKMETWAKGGWTGDATELMEVLAFTTDSDGKVTLSALPKKVGNVNYAGGLLDQATQTLTVKKNSAKVILNIGEGTKLLDNEGSASTEEYLYATSKTNLVIVDGKGGVTTYTGYSKFPGDPDAKTFTVGSDDKKGEVKAIFYVTATNTGDPQETVTDIVVIGSDEQPAPQKLLLAATGNWREVAGKDGNEKEWQFIDAATGKADYYKVDGSDPEKDKVYEGEVGPEGFKGKEAIACKVLQVISNEYVKVDIDGEGTEVVLYMPAGFTAYKLEGPGAEPATITLKDEDGKDVEIYFAVKKAPKADEEGDVDWSTTTNEDRTLTGVIIAKAPPAGPGPGEENGGGDSPSEEDGE